MLHLKALLLFIGTLNTVEMFALLFVAPAVNVVAGAGAAARTVADSVANGDDDHHDDNDQNDERDAAHRKNVQVRHFIRLKNFEFYRLNLKMMEAKIHVTNQSLISKIKRLTEAGS